MFKLLKDKLKGFIKGKSKEFEEESDGEGKKRKIDKGDKKEKKNKLKKEIISKDKKEKRVVDKNSKKEVKKEVEKEEREISDGKNEEDIGVNEDKKGFFSKLKEKVSFFEIKQENVDNLFDGLEIILLENNVALDVVEMMKRNLSENLVGKKIKKSELEKIITGEIRKSVLLVFGDDLKLIDEIKKSKGVYVIVFFGINGAGKTTSIAKLAYKLKKEKVSCVLVAGDTFRAASIEQLEFHSKKLGVPLIKQSYGADPTAVAFDAKKYAEKKGIKCVLVDTAGRMHTNENLLNQMKKMERVIKPNKKIFVGESITGNDSIEQVKAFSDSIGIDGFILSKSDIDEKGGTILSLPYVFKKPIYFLGVGQGYEDLEEFDKEKILERVGLD
jgi:fused signal recognition particle receptor